MLIAVNNIAVNIIAYGILFGLGILAFVSIYHTLKNKDIEDPHDCFDDDDNQFI